MITSSGSSKSTMPPFIKVSQVVKALSISRYTIKALIESGDLEAAQLAPTPKTKRLRLKRVHVRITRESLARFCKDRFDRDLESMLQVTSR